MTHRDYIEHLAEGVASGFLSMDEAALLSRQFAVEQLDPIMQLRVNLRPGEIPDADAPL